MAIFAAFAVGLFCGASLGVFSFVILEFFVSVVTVLDGFSEGFARALALGLERSGALMTGFLVGLVCSALISKIKHETADWRLRGHDLDARPEPYARVSSRLR